eukprot:2990205-Rhodomonas_salina.1
MTSLSWPHAVSKWYATAHGACALHPTRTHSRANVTPDLAIHNSVTHTGTSTETAFESSKTHTILPDTANTHTAGALLWQRKP